MTFACATTAAAATLLVSCGLTVESLPAFPTSSGTCTRSCSQTQSLSKGRRSAASPTSSVGPARRAATCSTHSGRRPLPRLRPPPPPELGAQPARGLPRARPTLVSKRQSVRFKPQSERAWRIVRKAILGRSGCMVLLRRVSFRTRPQSSALTSPAAPPKSWPHLHKGAAANVWGAAPPRPAERNLCAEWNADYLRAARSQVSDCGGDPPSGRHCGG